MTRTSTARHEHVIEIGVISAVSQIPHASRRVSPRHRDRRGRARMAAPRWTFAPDFRPGAPGLDPL